MIVSKLSLKNFKNLSGEFELSPMINTIIGNNGMGKTNFLESIFYLGRTNSFRHANDRNLINWDSELPFTKVESEIIDLESEDITELEYIISNENSLRKKFILNGLSVPRAKFAFNLPVLMFSPSDIEFMIGSPDIRRDYLDDFLDLVLPDFRSLRIDYKKILKNRNKLLKMIRNREARDDELAYWDEGLITLGSQIIEYRIKTLIDFLPYIKRLSEEVFLEDLRSLDFDYESKIVEGKHARIDEIRENFEMKIYAGRDKEIAAAMTLYGPQRDDLQFFYKNGGSLKRKINLHEFGSRGQLRIISILFKLAMWFYYEEKYERKPIMLLDDIMSELDKNHRKNLEESILKMKSQAILTSTSNEDFSKEFLNSSSFTRIQI